MDSFEALQRDLTQCRACPRLVAWREEVAQTKRRSFIDEEYWGKPVPYFGDPKAKLLILGLAPAAHGANRTGRMFTGDRSGDFLFAALHRAGLASQPRSEHPGDGLTLRGVLIAAAAHCAPPANKPTPDEVANCRQYLVRLLEILEPKSILCLGSLAWENLHRTLALPRSPFGHGVSHSTPDGILLVGSYHPSQQNTFTGRLTPPMMDNAIRLWQHGAEG